MKSLVQGYDLLDKGLNGYVIKNIYMIYEKLEIIAKSEDGNKTVKLQFEDVRDIRLNGKGVNSVISSMKLEKTDDGRLDVQIEKNEDIEMKLNAGKLVVTEVTGK